MAKFKSIFIIEGTLGELTFYKLKNGKHYVKRKTSIPRERILLDPAFARTRENYSEFGAVARAGMLVRGGASLLLKNARDPEVSARLTSVLAKVKNCDPDAARGQRTVGKGLLTPEGKALLNGFDFNAKSPLDSVLSCPYTLKANHLFELSSFVPATMLRHPESATHVSFRTALLNVDFELGTTVMHYSPVELLPLDRTPTDLSLSPSTLPTGNGFTFWLLHISFLQELNGEHYSLHDQSYNVLHLLRVEEL